MSLCEKESEYHLEEKEVWIPLLSLMKKSCEISFCSVYRNHRIIELSRVRMDS